MCSVCVCVLVCISVCVCVLVCISVCVSVCSVCMCVLVCVSCVHGTLHHMLLSLHKHDTTIDPFLFTKSQVLAHGTPLLSSTGDEFALENDPDYQKMSFQERASFHRQQLQEQLGLVSQGKVFSTGLEALIDDSDLDVTTDVVGSASSGRQLLQQHVHKVCYNELCVLQFT